MSLEALGKALYLEVLELKKERERALESRTLAGHAKNLMGYMLSAYCLYKYVLSAPALCDSNITERCIEEKSKSTMLLPQVSIWHIRALRRK